MILIILFGGLGVVWVGCQFIASSNNIQIFKIYYEYGKSFLFEKLIIITTQKQCYLLLIRIEFPTTINELKLIDKAATNGITYPAIAIGIVKIL